MCDDQGKQQRSSAFGLATGATVAVGAGLAALAGGGLLYFLAPRGSAPLAAITPAVGAREAGVLLQRTF